jgi:hypothetical protein
MPCCSACHLYCVIHLIRASPRVCQINLASIYFWQNRKKLCSNSLTFNLTNFSNLANPPLHAHICALSAHPASRANLSGALRFLTELFVRLADLFLFYQVQMANSWRESIFLLAIYFSELLNHDICQVNFGKLL